MIKFRKLKLFREAFSFLVSDAEERRKTESDFKLAVATDSLEAGREMAELLSLGSKKEIPVFNLEPLPLRFDLVIFLLLDWSQKNLAQIKSLIKKQPDYLVVSMASLYLPLAFRVGREFGIPSHRLFVWNEKGDYHDFFKGALRLAGSRKLALVKSHPAFFFYWQELLASDLALKLGWQALKGFSSFPYIFVVNLKNLNQLFYLSPPKFGNKQRFVYLSLLALPASLIQTASARALGSKDGKALGALCVGLSTFLTYRLLTPGFIKEKVL